MEDDGSPLNNFGKGLKKLFGKNRRGSGDGSDRTGNHVYGK